MIERAKKKRSFEQSNAHISVDTFGTINVAGFDKIGSGTYGQVFVSKDDSCVLKIAGCPDGIDVRDPNRSEQVEQRIMHHLWDKYVETGMTPHFTAPYGTSKLINGHTKKSEVSHSIIYHMEYAPVGNLMSYLHNLPFEKVEYHFKVILFQIAYTLSVAKDFRHNDLKDDNVLLHIAPETGSVMYTIFGRDYYLPCIGVTAAIGDFDFACVWPDMLNYKVISYEWEQPQCDISTSLDNGTSDLNCFVANMCKTCKNSLGGKLKDQLHSIFGVFFKRRPTVEDLFVKFGFFDEFLEGAPIREHYADKSTLLTNVPTFPFKLVAPSKCNVPLLVSLLQKVYDGPLEHQIKMKRGFKLDAFRREEFFDKVAKELEHFLLPAVWHYAAATCAFVHTIIAMKLYKSKSKYWMPERWCQFWEYHRCVQYLPIQLYQFEVWYVRTNKIP